MYLQGMSARSHKFRSVKRKAYFRRIPKSSVMSSRTPCLRVPALSAFSNNRLISFSYVSTYISRSGKARLDDTQIRVRWMRTRAIATRPKAPKMHETNCPTSGTVSKTFKMVAIFSRERVGSGGGGTILRSSVRSTIQPITPKPVEGESLAFLLLSSIKLRINSDVPTLERTGTSEPPGATVPLRPATRQPRVAPPSSRRSPACETHSPLPSTGQTIS